MAELYSPDSIIQSRKPIKESSRDQWPWADRWKFEQGKYKVKFISHRDKCRDGFRLYTVHSFEKNAGDKKKDRIKLFCTESTHGMNQVKYTDEHGKEKIAGVLNRPCYICDLVEDMRRLDDGQWFTEVLDNDFQTIIHEMSVTQSRCYLFPILIYARKVDRAEGGFRFVPDERNVMGMILTLRLGQDAADMSLYRLICKMSAAAGDDFFNPDGIWCTWSKEQTGQDLDVDKPRRLSQQEEKIYKSLPGIDEYGNGVKQGSFQRPSLAVGYDRAMALVKSTWWAQAMAKQGRGEIGYDFDDPEIKGLACEPPDVPAGNDDLGYSIEDEEDPEEKPPVRRRR